MGNGIGGSSVRLLWERVRVLRLGSWELVRMLIEGIWFEERCRVVREGRDGRVGIGVVMELFDRSS